MAVPSLGESYTEIIPGLVENSGSRRTAHYATLSAAADEDSANRKKANRKFQISFSVLTYCSRINQTWCGVKGKQEEDGPPVYKRRRTGHPEDQIQRLGHPPDTNKDENYRPDKRKTLFSKMFVSASPKSFCIGVARWESICNRLRTDSASGSKSAKRKGELNDNALLSRANAS